MPQLNAQGVDSHIPDLAGIWDGTPRVRPVNGETVPWGENNFPDLNARARAYQEVWEEIMAPKYDCQPASSPAIQYDPYHMQLTQWPDRVLFRYEKDDQLRTVWLDGREPTATDFSLQGFSRGYYEAKLDCHEMFRGFYEPKLNFDEISRRELLLGLSLHWLDAPLWTQPWAAE